MQPSSLILLAIVVVWAAYLVPQWVRRRDEMSQSRAGDRFSGGLRVLKRRERSSRSGRSGDPLLTSPRVIVDTDGELLYIPADRLLAERLAGSSMSLPQSARPGETLLGTPAPVTPEPAASARPDQEEPTAPAEPEHVPAVEAEGRVEVAARQSEAAIQGEPEAKTGKAAPVASATPDSATPAPVTTTAPSSPSAEDSMAELEAGLLAGFGLTAPSVTPAAQAEAMPSVQAPSAPQSADQRVGQKGAADEDMAELEAGLLAGFGLSAPPTRVAHGVPASSASPTDSDAQTDRTLSATTSAGGVGQGAHPAPTTAPNAGQGNAGWTSTGQTGGAQTNAAQTNVPQANVPQANVPQANAGRASVAQTSTGRTSTGQTGGAQTNAAQTNAAQTNAARPDQPRRAPRRPEQAATARAEGMPSAESPQPAASRRPARRTGPAQTSPDYVPGSRPVRKPRNPAPADSTDNEPAWVVEPPAASTTVPVTTSAPISASAEAAQESFQELIGRPGSPAPEALEPQEHEAEEAPLTEYTTTHSDLDSARLSARVAARRRARSMAVLLIATIAAWVFSVAGSIPVFVPLAATLLLAAHAVASRTAAVRSRESLTMLAAHLYAAEMAREHAEKRRRTAEARTRARVEAEAAAPPPERVARRAAAVSADTWDPIPVPPPTYTLKPAVHRPPPPPLETPAEKPQHKPSDRQVSRGSMPRRAADIERILELDETELPRAVNE